MAATLVLMPESILAASKLRAQISTLQTEITAFERRIDANQLAFAMGHTYDRSLLGTLENKVLPWKRSLLAEAKAKLAVLDSLSPIPAEVGDSFLVKE